MARNKEFDEEVVLRKALELFLEKGYEKSSIQDLVACMGIHRRSIYDTFGDKHTLFINVLEKYQKLWRAKVNSTINNENSVKEAIRKIFEIGISKSDFNTYGCMIVNTAVELGLHDEESNQKVRDSYSNTEKLFHELILSGQKTGEISMEENAEQLSQYLLNSFIGIRVLVKSENNNEKLNNIIDMTLSCIS
ncbi:TetR family transcriptional regulator [Bacillus sp. AFS001701]|uniref:TetR/AcrR family transcriptional regulator n=1 Tax=Bacillaceae TaxID=186817 RepID=UPI000BF782F2|nr:TetR/AcrR family transcriptional regulator [Bacillus sp. AFS001701]PET44823.1 TetR family transcriptional regulator [Bacillus sp. AFS001701]